MARRRSEPYGIPLGKRRLKRALQKAAEKRWGLEWRSLDEAGIIAALTETNSILADLPWTESP